MIVLSNHIIQCVELLGAAVGYGCIAKGYDKCVVATIGGYHARFGLLSE